MARKQKRVVATACRGGVRGLRVRRKFALWTAGVATVLVGLILCTPTSDGRPPVQVMYGAIPEPGTLGLLAITSLIALVRRPRRG